MASAAARKAWNDAMKASAPTHIRAGAAPRKRRSERRSRHAAKSTSGGGGSTLESKELQRALWMDVLEGVDANAMDATAAADDDDDVYDEFEDLDDDGGRRTAKPKKRKARKTTTKAGAGHKRFLPRPLGSILLEEASRPDGVAKQFIESQAMTQQQLPPRKFCPVSGLPALFREPKSGHYYSTYSALEQIRERSPPWMSLSGGSAATFSEAVKSIQDSTSSS